MAKNYKELCFTDNFMFCKVVSSNPELCRHMLELILGKSIRKVDIKTTEKVIDLTPESIIVIICTFDYFNKGLTFYVFENRCEALPELPLGDGTRKIFVNPHGDRKGLPEDVVSFLDYIKDHTAEDAFTGELEQAVEKARTHKEIVSSFL